MTRIANTTARDISLNIANKKTVIKAGKSIEVSLETVKALNGKLPAGLVFTNACTPCTSSKDILNRKEDKTIKGE